MRRGVDATEATEATEATGEARCARFPPARPRAKRRAGGARRGRPGGSGGGAAAPPGCRMLDPPLREVRILDERSARTRRTHGDGLRDGRDAHRRRAAITR